MPLCKFWPSLDASDADAEEAAHNPILAIGLRWVYDPEFSVMVWASKACLSDRQLRRRVLDLTGLSPQIWVRERRIHNVHRLITTGKCRTLVEAGLNSGLENPNYLYRLYRERFGNLQDSPAD